jgi:hypothetical protein
LLKAVLFDLGDTMVVEETIVGGISGKRLYRNFLI